MGEEHALKLLKQHASLKDTEREVAVLTLQHRNLLDFEALVIGNDLARPVAGIMSALCETNLQTYITDFHRRSIPPNTMEDTGRRRQSPVLPILEMKALTQLVLDVARGMAKLHAHKFVHRDLKPANVLLNSSHNGTMHALVCDFESAKKVTGADANQTMSVVRTTGLYSAPETFTTEQFTWSASCDVWAFGLIVGFVFTGLEPLSGVRLSNPASVCLCNWRDRPDENPSPASVYENSIGVTLPKHVMEHVVRPCLELDPARRPSMLELCRRLRVALDDLDHQPPSATKLYRVMYSTPPEFDLNQGIFAKNPGDTTYTAKQHIQNGSLRTAFVSTTTSFTWALYYAVRTLVVSGYHNNPFIVEIDVKVLVDSAERPEFFCAQSQDEVAELGLAGRAANFAISALEVCLKSSNKDTAAIPAASITGCFRLDLEQREPRLGRNGRAHLGVLDVRHRKRQDFIRNGVYHCQHFETFTEWSGLFNRYFSSTAQSALRAQLQRKWPDDVMAHMSAVRYLCNDTTGRIDEPSDGARLTSLATPVPHESMGWWKSRKKAQTLLL
eukprot:INCI12703.2.p1 GENE.INCI12703.2~~INCI12703.2.p1  ORF type:complete len:627 (+),score=78.88 INCI12703.2:212-1882(+)